MENGPKEGLQPVEILHIDTENSQKFFTKLDVNQSEKCDCEKLLFDLFSQCCQTHNGYVAANWAGDGGHAFFPASQESGNSIHAAKEFMSKLQILAEQTATTLGRRATSILAKRRFRIKAHFGLVRITADGKFDSASSSDFDAFLKHEKELAPIVDELFITDQLKSQLGSPEKSLFSEFRKVGSYGALTSALYRLQTKPTNNARSIFEPGRRPQDLTEGEWGHLLNHIKCQRMNVAARNFITIGLIKSISDPQSRGQIQDAVLTNVTIRALFNYLKVAYQPHSFRVAVWRPFTQNGSTLLKKFAHHPVGRGDKSREVDVSDIRYNVARTFNSCIPIVTPSVSEARLKGDWIDFEDSQQEPERGLNSAIQLPVYRTKNKRGDYVEKESLGVLSVDSDKPDFFLMEELDIWLEDFIGYLANLALAEHIHRVGLEIRTN